MEEEIKSNEKKTMPVVKEQKKGNPLLIIILILLLIGNLILGWLYYQEKQQTHIVYVKLNNTNVEKEYIQKQLEDMTKGYEALKTDNEEMNAKIEEQKAKIQEIKKALQHTKNISYYQISQYKKELETLRKIMKSYIVQIDSLNTLNKQLKVENTQIKSSYYAEKNKNEELLNQNKDLSEKVSIAKEIRIFNLTVTSLNKKGKPNIKARKIKKIQVCFVLGENKVVPAGTKTVYLRIARPDGTIISSSEYDLFDFNGNKIVYTDKRDIEYNNKDTDVCIYWTNKNGEELIPGTYYADIFVGGKNIGTTTFKLK